MLKFSWKKKKSNRIGEGPFVIEKIDWDRGQAVLSSAAAGSLSSPIRELVKFNDPLVI